MCFNFLSNKALSEETTLPRYGQNLHQFIKTEIIDLPDDTSGQQTPFITPLDWYPRYPNNGNIQVDPPRNKRPQPVQGLKSGITNGNKVVSQTYQRPKESPNSSNISAINFSYIPPDQYYGIPYQQSPMPYYPRPLAYRPFYPSQYIRSYYPSLYNQFPNGFYVIPDTEDVSALSKGSLNTMANQPPKVVVNTERNRINIQQPIKNIIRSNQAAQPNNFHIFNHTNIGEKKTFVSHLELKPVSTKFTRYNNPDGKMYVKIISTDSNGEQKVTENEYNGNIDLKINNGVLETPGSKNTSVVKEIKPATVDEDPNSIMVERKAEQSTETGEPVDINSWIY